MDWTKDEVQKLRTWYHLGRSHGWMARQLNRTANSVTGKLHNMGLRSQIVPPTGGKPYLSEYVLTWRELRERGSY